MTPDLQPSTKDRILDAAERLFSQHGFDATSLRMITAGANVNLAAVNYHFQSKEALLEAVVGRRATPINARRLELLAGYEAKSDGRPVPVEQVLDAFIRPLFESGWDVPPLMVRMLYLEPKPVFKRAFQQHLLPTVQRFTAAFIRALPHVPPREVLLRIQFVLGAFAQVMAASERLEALSEGRFPAVDPACAAEHLIPFAVAGLKAPPLEKPL